MTMSGSEPVLPVGEGKSTSRRAGAIVLHVPRALRAGMVPMASHELAPNLSDDGIRPIGRSLRVVLRKDMTETMIERLARTLCRQAGQNPDALRDAGPGEGSVGDAVAERDSLPLWTHYIAHAAEILDVMRDPTERMAIGGAAAVPNTDLALHVEVAKDVWRAMILEAMDADHH